MSSAKQDSETLMNEFFGFAEQMLSEHSEFFPYGAAMKSNGELVAVAGYDGTEQPPSQEIIGLLNDGFARGARTGEDKATALFHNVRVGLPNNGPMGDAVAVALDHKDNYSVVVFFPYQIQNGHVSFEEVFAQQGTNDIFGTLD